MLLLAANLLIALTVGDFGRASRDFQAAFQHSNQIRSSTATAEEVTLADQQRKAALDRLNSQRTRFRWHVRLGIVAGLVTLLINSISITYFIGTNRWSREVVEAFGLDEQLALRSQKLKRNAFPWALLGIVLILVISGLGAISDPATLNPNAAEWVEYHWGLALVGLVLIAVCFLGQASAIGRNTELINEILRAAEEERARRHQLRASHAGAVASPSGAD